MVGIIAWIIIGLVAGAIATTLRDGHEPGGVLGTLAVGVAGALLGGLLAWGLGDGRVGSFVNIGTWLIAMGGAFVLLLIFDAVIDRHPGRHNSGARG